MKTAMAGTLESMDCLVTVTEQAPGSGIAIEIEGSSAARFATAIKKAIKDTLASLEVTDISVLVNDHGALDIVLAARTEAAVKRMRG